MIDDDKRKLRLYQERYLVDGDLHAEGPGRQRRFRWKNTGSVWFPSHCFSWRGYLSTQVNLMQLW